MSCQHYIKVVVNKYKLSQYQTNISFYDPHRVVSYSSVLPYL